jgi:hypothetical protein
MGAISNLSSLATLGLSDQLAISSAAGGVDAKVAVSVLLQFLKDNITTPGDLVTQYAAPNATGFSVSVAAAGDGLGQSVWLLMTPGGAYAAGTIVLPPVGICRDKQQLLVSTRQAVTALTVNGNGALVNGAPTTLAANASFRLRFDAPTASWYFTT